MTTPTPMKHAPSQQGRTPSQMQGRTPSQLAAPTPPVSTPFSNAAHTAFSPNGPRSSPQQVKKSPATSLGLMHHPSNPPLNFDSPSTAAAMGALGINGALDMSLDGVGVAALGALGPLNGEDDKLKRLETILEILGKKKGLVSEAGLERLAHRIGFESLNEDQTTPDGRKVKTLIIAGSFTSIDVVLENNIVQSVTLGFPESAESVVRRMDPASSILLKDLQLAPKQSPLTKTLDKFAANLEHLAVLDKLSILPALDCRQALAGVYESLEKLHHWEVNKLKEEKGMDAKSEQYRGLVAMCSKSGFPVMHARERVGLAVQYWRERRFAPASAATSSVAENERIWSLLIGCAAANGLEVPPIRVSEEWTSKDIAKSDPLDPAKTIIDWQEPENVSLPESNKGQGMDMLQPDLSMARVPQVTFTVSFEPPLILPQNDWARLYTYANVSAPPVFGYPPTFDALLFPLSLDSAADPSELRIISHERDVRVFDKELKPATKSHRNRLFIYKQIYAQPITDIPFSHPRQLVQMLPLLRQYAFITTLLENSFGAVTKPGQSRGPSTNGDGKAVKNGVANVKDDLQSILAFADPSSPQPQADTKGSDLVMDVILWVHPTPHFQVSFPFRDSTVSFTLYILENAVVELTEEDLIAQLEKDGHDKGKLPTREGLGKALEHLEDLCKWSEWIRTRYS